MTSKQHNEDSLRPLPIRWWPGALIALVATALIVWVRSQADWPFQQRNLNTYKIAIISTILLLVWWTFLSRAPKRLRLGITFGSVIAGVLLLALFRIGGASGDLGLILEFRWAQKRAVLPTAIAADANWSSKLALSGDNDFPQFLGPDRTGVLPQTRLNADWTAHPPQVLWREPVGAAWSGFAIVGDIALTQEQRGEDECVVARELSTGRQLWVHTDKARYNTTIAGEGPRATPTVSANRVFAMGATGLLNCLDLATGRSLWSHDLLAVNQGKVPDWGFAGSPLLVDGLVIVHGSDNGKHSLHAFRAEDGQPMWSAGTMNPGYASPVFATLAGVEQVLSFNDGSVSAHDPATGATLWERPWGNGNVVCSSPVVVSSNQVLFSSGYGVGAQLLEISRAGTERFKATPLWKSIRMKAKFSQLFARDGFVYGLDDGIYACVDLRDGSQRWKEGRYGHGQGLALGDHFLLMAESGELVLLKPTPDASNEITRFRVFNSKTWNPIALSGDLLLVRNDREAACLRLALLPGAAVAR
ncbi:MAG TPA: PQQ-binding-like beta-propeller repeat protein [Verrucomicrobiota bacterium]|nr:PQQ-binding-like beta-propeller repeat protein [Verrucomicrobiota bacterium]